MLLASITRSFAFAGFDYKKNIQNDIENSQNQGGNTDESESIIYECSLDALIPVSASGISLPQSFRFIFNSEFFVFQHQITFPVVANVVLSYFENVFSSLIIPNAP